MTRYYAALLLALPFAVNAQSIATQGFTFNPSVLTVTAGTEITLNIGGAHTMTEVDEATWNANGNTWNGGFNFDGGTHTLTLDLPGTYYYVCVPHASAGMKGRIVVESNTGVAQAIPTPTFALYPNPTSSELVITTASAPEMSIVLIDAQGREALRQTLSGNDRISVSHIRTGNYTALLMDATGIIRARERLSIIR